MFPPLGYFLLAAKMSPYMVDRYIMPVFPFAAMAAAGLLLCLLRRFGPAHRIFPLCIVLLLTAVNIFNYDGEYLYKGYGAQLGMSREYADLPCICIYEGYSFYDNLLEFENYERTLLVKPSELAGRQDIAELPEAIVLIKQNVGPDSHEEIMEILADYGLKQDYFLLRGSGVYGDMLLHYVNTSLN